MHKLSFGITLWVIAVALFFNALYGKSDAIVTFQECMQAGNQVLESSPRQCRNRDGVIFIEMIK
ncbi:MAG: hypothetical protein Q8R26_01545 [bacterium]|nr:hypothetical protein [bacterium]